MLYLADGHSEKNIWMFAIFHVIILVLPILGGGYRVFR